MPIGRVDQANFDRQGRMLDLRIKLMDVLSEHAAEKMTPAEVIHVLLELADRMVSLQLTEELT